jgi:putative membrane protein
MKGEQKIIQSAEFSPNIKNYILFYVAFILLVTIAGIPLLIFWFLGLGQYISGRYYENLKCTLTESHLEFKKGVLFRIEKTIPLENIQDLTFIENPLLKMLDLRILKIETAGQSNPQGSDMKLIGIVNTLEFKDKVLHQRELMRKGNLSEMRGQKSEDIQTNQLLIEIRDILLDIKNKN